jgi:hypothetical protein
MSPRAFIFEVMMAFLRHDEAFAVEAKAAAR